jgi:hypothetical protein
MAMAMAISKINNTYKKHSRELMVWNYTNIKFEIKFNHCRYLILLKNIRINLNFGN